MRMWWTFIGVVASSAASACGGTLLYAFEGEVTTASGSGEWSDVSVGDTVRLFVEFDPDVSVSDDGPTERSWGGASIVRFEWEVVGERFDFATSPRRASSGMFIENDADEEGATVDRFGGFISTGDFWMASFTLETYIDMAPGGPLDSVDALGPGFSADDFEFGTMFMSRHFGGSLRSRITSMTVTPAPGGMVLAACGCAPLAGRRRRV